MSYRSNAAPTPPSPAERRASLALWWRSWQAPFWARWLAQTHVVCLWFAAVARLSCAEPDRWQFDRTMAAGAVVAMLVWVIGALVGKAEKWK